METAQNIIIFILLCITIWLYFDRKSLKYWRDYYKQEYEYSQEDLVKNIQKNIDLSSKNVELEDKLNKAEEIISQQKQELLTRKTKKK